MSRRESSLLQDSDNHAAAHDDGDDNASTDNDDPRTDYDDASTDYNDTRTDDDNDDDHDDGTAWTDTTMFRLQ